MFTLNEALTCCCTTSWPIARQHLAFLFWPDSTQEQARNRLLRHLRRRHRPLAALAVAAGRGRLPVGDLGPKDIVGVLGIEADPELGRAWIYGPLVRHPEGMARWPTSGSTRPLCRPSRPASTNSRCSATAGIRTARPWRLRHGFKLFERIRAIMALKRADLDRVPRAICSPIDERYYDQFATYTPGSYRTRISHHNRSSMAGRKLAFADRDARGRIAWIRVFPGRTGCFEGYIDFVAVTETARRRGIGAQLVAAAAHSAFVGLTSTLSGSR